MYDADRTPRCPPAEPTNDIDAPRQSIDDLQRSSPEDISPSMSRSSSKASSIDTLSKPPKPRRPTNYAERTSSKRASLPQQPKNLNLNQSNFASATQQENVSSPPVSAKETPKPAFTPIIERSQDSRREPETSSPSPTEPTNQVIEEIEIPYFPLTPPTRPEIDVPKIPSTRLYWHQLPTHGMMSTGPLRRSHSIAQIGFAVYIFGGSDGKPPMATNTVYIFDTGTPPREDGLT
jgi:Kelch motif